VLLTDARGLRRLADMLGEPTDPALLVGCLDCGRAIVLHRTHPTASAELTPANALLNGWAYGAVYRTS